MLLTQQRVSAKISSTEFLYSIIREIEHDQLGELSEELWISFAEEIVSQIWEEWFNYLVPGVLMLELLQLIDNISTIWEALVHYGSNIWD